MNSNIDYVELYEREKQKEIRKTFSRFMLALSLLTIVAYAVIYLVEFILIMKMGASEVTLLLDNIYIQWAFGVGPMYLFGVPVLYLVVMKMKTAPREKKRLSAKDFFAIFLICQGVTFVGSLIGQTFTAALGEIFGKDITAGATDLVEKSPVWLTLAIAVILGPVIEELIFRKLLIDRISRYGDLTAIITSGIAFGIFHGNFEQLFYAVLIGFVLAFVYTKTGNVLHTILLHIFINFMGSTVALPVMQASNRVMEASEILVGGGTIDLKQFTLDTMLVTSYSVVQYAMVFAGLFILFRAILKKKIEITNNSAVYVKGGRMCQNAILNFGTVLFLVLSFILFVAGILLS